VQLPVLVDERGLVEQAHRHFRLQLDERLLAGRQRSVEPRQNAIVAGQLPRVIASYNAGPLPVGRWAAINDKGDPLLWIESIPYWETRYYVPAVLRNMWVYQGLNHESTATLKSMTEHHWPSFPTSMTRLAH
jgi:hypothetical protein